MSRQAHLEEVVRDGKQSLPRFYAISGALKPDGSQSPILEQAEGRAWLERFKILLESDIELVQVRVKQLDSDHLEHLIPTCLAVASRTATRLILNGPATVVSDNGLAGIHLTANALNILKSRPLPAGFLVGASCHTPQELHHAERIGCDFACLSPVQSTKWYESVDVLGYEQFSDWVSRRSIPVYGLGGLKREDLGEIMAAGGHGVAGISAFW